MLKIKENVDLKELEKFGFVYRKHLNRVYRNNNWIKLHNEKDYEDYVDNYIQIGNDRILKPYTRILNGHNKEYCDNRQTNIKNEFLDTLYDLIKADLVEKVEE